MRDIRGDLQDRASFLEEQLSAAQAQFEKRMELFTREHEAKIHDLQAEFEAVTILMDRESQRVMSEAEMEEDVRPASAQPARVQRARVQRPVAERDAVAEMEAEELALEPRAEDDVSSGREYEPRHDSAAEAEPAPRQAPPQSHVHQPRASQDEPRQPYEGDDVRPMERAPAPPPRRSPAMREAEPRRARVETEGRSRGSVPVEDRMPETRPAAAHGGHGNRIGRVAPVAHSAPVAEGGPVAEGASHAEHASLVERAPAGHDNEGSHGYRRAPVAHKPRQVPVQAEMEPSPPPRAQQPPLPLADFLIRMLGEAGALSLEDLCDSAISEGYFAEDDNPDRTVHMTLMNVVKAGFIRQAPNGMFAPASVMDTIRLRRAI